MLLFYFLFLTSQLSIGLVDYVLKTVHTKKFKNAHQKHEHNPLFISPHPQYVCLQT